MGVVVRRYIDMLTIIINFPYSTYITSFFATASLLLCSFFLNVFSVLFLLFFYNIKVLKEQSRSVVQKNRDHANIII